MIENDTWHRCNICGREGRVGRCCSDEDRTPLHALAFERIHQNENNNELQKRFFTTNKGIKNGLLK